MAFTIFTSIRSIMVSGWNFGSPFAVVFLARWPRPPKSKVRYSRPLSLYRFISGSVPWRSQASRSAFTLFWLLVPSLMPQPTKMPLRASTQADKYIRCSCPDSVRVTISMV